MLGDGAVWHWWRVRGAHKERAMASLVPAAMLVLLAAGAGLPAINITEEIGTNRAVPRQMPQCRHRNLHILVRRTWPTTTATVAASASPFAGPGQSPPRLTTAPHQLHGGAGLLFQPLLHEGGPPPVGCPSARRLRRPRRHHHPHVGKRDAAAEPTPPRTRERRTCRSAIHC
jgi:hypothetical protein